MNNNIENLKNEKFSKSYNKLFYSDIISLEEKCIIQIILSYEVNNQKCYLSYENWAVILSCSIRKAKTIMSGLRDKLFIEWVSGYNIGGNVKANTYSTTQFMYDVIFKFD